MLGHIGLNKNSKANQTFDKESNLSQLPSDILKQIERASSDLVTISDLSGVIWFVSDSVERVLGYAKQDLIGKSVSRYIMQDDFKKCSKNLPGRGRVTTKILFAFPSCHGKIYYF
ncbi:PAS domain-containing protein [Gracilibacillus sp. JCM 18860]|uniref:PAS domain-containing protein n=1 Tax=Gracilibacillus sp. JCM 18860 TaxID=1306159 RepID=UPI000AAF215F